MAGALASKILIEGIDDWVPLGALYGWAKPLASGSDEEQRSEIAAALVELLGDGLIVAGEVIDGRGFVPSDNSIDVVLKQVQRRVVAGSSRDFMLWFANTESGDAAARRLNDA